MIKTFNITKKLSIRLSIRGFRFSFTFLAIYFDRFLDYNLVFQFLNMELMFRYKNTKQQEALAKLNKTMSELGDD